MDTETARIPVVVAGITGKTGSAVGRAVYQAPDLALAGGLSRNHAGENLGALWGIEAFPWVLGDTLGAFNLPHAVLVDFTEPETALPRLLEAAERGWDIVAGTTGFSAEGRVELANCVVRCGVGAAVIANFSLGAWVAERLAAEASRYFATAEILEGHHVTKRDRPSGTARAMAETLGQRMKRSPDDIPVHSLRLPGMVAHQTVVFGSQGQLLSIRHDVHDRTAYVDGVLAAIRWVCRVEGRMVTDLGEILDSEAAPHEDVRL